ncbi:MAG TPA: ABC transporter substrate-binding protein [Acidisphaera sp.]|nr:ABC transporter substrate-binding protein [Acidisphaera sp.]
MGVFSAMRRVERARRCVLAVLASVALCSARPASAVQQDRGGSSVEIAAALCLSGDEQPIAQSTLEGIQLAVDEANARGDGPRIVLHSYDEKSDVETGKAIAGQIVASRVALVVGSVFSFLSLAEGPIFAKAGIADLPIATSDLITQNPTTFRVNFKNSEQGELIATYLSRVLGQSHVAAIWIDDGYGRTLQSGFATAATRLGLDATDAVFKTPAEAQTAAETVAQDPAKPAVALLMLDGPARRVLPTLRRLGVTAPIVGSDSQGGDLFAQRLAGEPEEQRRPGSLTEGLYAVSPMILDSANAEVLAFAARYRARYGHDPAWEAVSGYDATLLAIAAIRAAVPTGTTEPATTRAAVLAYLQSLTSPANAIAGLLGPIWFGPDRGRVQAIRVGRFSGGHFESAPLQVVPVTAPSASEEASGAVFEAAPGRYARLQRVVYTGLYLNGVSHIDLSKSSFGADFYLWLRFAKDAGADSLDPGDINFPNMLSGAFDPARPAEQGDMPDGTIYRLWRVQREFRNDFDLHEFPFDRQRLQLPFYNARGASDRIVYVVDQRTAASGPPTISTATPGQPPALTASNAFNDLTQWRALGATERRQNLVTDSPLGDPRRIGTEGYRELSGFIATFDLQRRALSTVEKSLMPLLLMTLIIYATLHFPPVLIKEKVTVAITGALSGAVLLTAINNQLGSVGYTIAIEYAFFVFFGLTTFAIFAALAAQHFRHVKRDHLAVATERGTRAVFILAIIGLLAGAWFVSASSAAVR